MNPRILDGEYRRRYHRRFSPFPDVVRSASTVFFGVSSSKEDTNLFTKYLYTSRPVSQGSAKDSLLPIRFEDAGNLIPPNDRILSDISITWYKRLMPRRIFCATHLTPPELPLVLGRRLSSLIIRKTLRTKIEKGLTMKGGGQRLEGEQKTVEEH